ncbi:MAG: DNA polymerase ligase N-terminal domain-containing protein [Chitinophagaceae bacterium]
MLSLYNKKRDFTQTPEPAGHNKKEKLQHRFVVQQHNASRLHYDFRLQLNGVLKSWAVPKGPSMDAADKRLAVQVEDHPVSYINFSGTIPKGNYGAGAVKIWDKGSYTPIDDKGNSLTDKQAVSWLKKGELKFKLEGKKLKGDFVLVQLKNDPKNWLLIKHAKPVGNDEKTLTNKKAVARKAPAASARQISKTVVPLTALPTQRKLTHYYKPMLATPAATPFDDAAWIFEIKWDGYRAIAECGEKDLRFYSRNGLSFIHKYPSVAKALQRLKKSMVIDGEIVVLDAAGKPSFQLLQQYEGHPEYNIVYYIFDLLYLDGKDIRDLPLSNRKALLKKVLPSGKKSIIRFCDHVKKDGISFFKKASALDLEGMIAKKSDSVYAGGVRNNQWLKIKRHNTREAVIAGFTQPKAGRKYLGALILAEQRGKS